MIPLKISLKNFLSYGPTTQTIDFEPYHLICLSGKNGHGKSALLDAMSWALWGQARKIIGTAKPDSQLLHLGQTYMKVVFDIALKDSVYRIKREFSKTHGKSGSILEVSIFDTLSESFKPLTTNALRTTQQRLEEIIGLSYDSFINTAFLRQGSSNEFSKKSPKDRKEILSTILGLNHYEVVRKSTHDKIKHLELKIQTLNNRQMTLKAYLEQLPGSKAQLETINQALEHNDLSYKDHQATYLALQAKEEKLFEEVTRINYTISQLSFAAQAHQQTKDNIIASIKEWRTLLCNARDTSQHKSNSYAQHLELLSRQSLEYQRITTTINLTTDQLSAIKQSLECQRQQLEQQYTIALHKSDTQRALNQQQCDELNKTMSVIQERCNAYKATIDSFWQKYKTYKPDEYDEFKIKFEKYKQYFHQWTAHANALSNHYTTYQKVLTPSGLSNDCPVCHQALTQQQKDTILHNNSKNTIVLERRIERLSKVLNTLKQMLIEQHTVLQDMSIVFEHYKQRLAENQLAKNTLQTDSVQLSNFERQYQELIHAQQELNDQHQNILQKMNLDRNTPSYEIVTYKELEQNLIDYQQQRNQLCYDQEAHHTLLQQSEQHFSALQKSAHLTSIIQKTYSQQRTFIDAIIDWKTQKIVHTHLAVKKDYLQQKNEDIALCKDQRIKVEKLLASYQSERGELLEQKGKTSQHHQQLIHYQQELFLMENTLVELIQEKKDLDTICSALGKDGIQALFIEEVIPAIEQEANRLLAQLTDNQSQLFIDSLRDLKSGGTKETLDIKIADAQGIRSYELFSGGEAFRIDFALRIAISRLIASRTGGSLQTLIIDEGFGSQDEEGLSHIMDVLYRIQSSFAKIIIVSHLSSMKEQFPVHFIINKESQGSVVRALQQG